MIDNLLDWIKYTTSSSAFATLLPDLSPFLFLLLTSLRLCHSFLPPISLPFLLLPSSLSPSCLLLPSPQHSFLCPFITLPCPSSSPVSLCYRIDSVLIFANDDHSLWRILAHQLRSCTSSSWSLSVLISSLPHHLPLGCFPPHIWFHPSPLLTWLESRDHKKQRCWSGSGFYGDHKLLSRFLTKGSHESCTMGARMSGVGAVSRRR